MNRHRILSLSAITAFGLALLPCNAIGQQKSLKDELVGTWMLVSQENTAPDGTKREPYGANPSGILMLNAGGQYAVVIGQRDRPRLTSRNRLETTPAEWSAATMGFAAHFGTWSVDEANKILVRRFVGALIPNNEGTDIKTSVALVGDELSLTDGSAARGGTTVSVFRRAK